MFLTGVVSPEVREAAVTCAHLGMLNTPATRYARHDWRVWAADNAAFNANTYPGDEAWIAWLTRTDPQGCLFATLPDVVGDWDATLARSLPWIDTVKALGYPAAIVLQNGCTSETVPWDQIDAVFIGGDDTFKLGPDVRDLVTEAKRRGLHVHMGRVNSEKRLRYAQHIGCDSADGTVLAFDPARLPKVVAWLDRLNGQAALFGGAA